MRQTTLPPSLPPSLTGCLNDFRARNEKSDIILANSIILCYLPIQKIELSSKSYDIQI